MPKFDEIVRAVVALVALGVVSYVAVCSQSETALGAVIALLSAAAGWLFRGRVAASEK